MIGKCGTGEYVSVRRECTKCGSGSWADVLCGNGGTEEWDGRGEKGESKKIGPVRPGEVQQQMRAESCTDKKYEKSE